MHNRFKMNEESHVMGEDVREGDTDSGCDDAHAVIVFAEKPEFECDDPTWRIVDSVSCHADFVGETIEEQCEGTTRRVIHIIRGIEIGHVLNLQDFLSAHMEGADLEALRKEFPDVDDEELIMAHAAAGIRDEVRQFLQTELDI